MEAKRQPTEGQRESENITAVRFFARVSKPAMRSLSATPAPQRFAIGARYKDVCNLLAGIG